MTVVDLAVMFARLDIYASFFLLCTLYCCNLLLSCCFKGIFTSA